MIQKLLDPFWQILAHPAHQLHPQIIHFPIVFLVLEAVTLIIFVIRKQPQVAALSLIFLHCAFWTMLLAVLTGLNDVGLDLGAGNRIMLGFRDRWENAFRAQSSVTIHVWLGVDLDRAHFDAARLALVRPRPCAQRYTRRHVRRPRVIKFLDASRCHLRRRIDHS